MATEWPSIPLADLTSAPVTYGVVQPGRDDPSGVPMLRVNNFVGNSLSFSDVLHISTTIEAKYARTRCKAGDVLVTVVGSVGQVATVPPELSGWNIARAIALVRPKTRDMSRWIACVLRSPQTQHRLGVVANTTVQMTVNLKDLRALEIPMPDATTRDGICDVLGALDDRIDNLRATNATLEAIAQALFKSWFVDFDPVYAKAKGHAPEGMDAATAVPFPGEFEDSELGPIPKGWRTGTLKDVCRVHDSKRVPLSGAEREKRRGTYPYYGAASVMDYVDDYIFDGIYVLLAEDGSVATKDGYALTQYVWGRFWVNNHAHILEGVGGFSTEQLLLLLQRVRVQQYITGAVQAKLSQRNMFTIPAVIPPRAISKAFDSLVSPLFARIRKGTEAGNTLIQLRDVLLPSLISGKLRLPEATEAAEAALA